MWAHWSLGEAVEKTKDKNKYWKEENKGKCGIHLCERREEKWAVSEEAQLWVRSEGGGWVFEAQGIPIYGHCAKHSTSGHHLISWHPYEPGVITPITYGGTGAQGQVKAAWGHTARMVQSWNYDPDFRGCTM